MEWDCEERDFNIVCVRGDAELRKIRNLGISAHIDSGKTTLTERILFYCNKINSIHDVGGKDGIGAKMDSMDLERQKGITIKSAATYVSWGENHINIIDTPGHVDFTIEVERALHVLDGAILVICGVSGVQSQTITVDRQMKRYNVPFIGFINKLDRMGAHPGKVIEQLQQKLGYNCAAVQIPIGVEENHRGLVDLIKMKALSFIGGSGEVVQESEIPENLVKTAEQARSELLERLFDADDDLAEKAFSGEELSEADIKASIRKLTIARKFIPIFMGSAFKNKGVQPLIDGTIDYLPSPAETQDTAFSLKEPDVKVPLKPDDDAPFVGLAFKLEESPHGQLTYTRVYQGTLNKGDTIVSMADGKKVKVPRVIRMHSDEMEDVQSIGSGEICAMFGVDCSSGTTFTSGEVQCTLESMFLPSPVISLSMTPKQQGAAATKFAKALSRFQKEDPTFLVHTDPASKQTIVSGMGELHLEIYKERLEREYDVEVITGNPKVAYKETATKRVEFDYLHKKQSGGAGQFARVQGFIEPIPLDEEEEDLGDGKIYKNGDRIRMHFVNDVIAGSIPSGFIPACEKGFLEAVDAGPLTEHPLERIRVVLNSGAFHAVDSSELAFRLACQGAFREAIRQAAPIILEPIMTVEITVPSEFQNGLTASISRRQGTVNSSTTEGQYTTFVCEVPLSKMMGYATDLRSMTEGKGEFSMEYDRYEKVLPDFQQSLIAEYQRDKKD
eukprot:TRINITY_DN12907_c0_g1_i1.p1 TRINITY_DN12907_c0_g1~~TRINITY_DN12907_c0_g1_i1.p1  ORF type:complete len:729 (+),score=137.65 TRINITY_DN12907_c0_g1_i1:141-2327(+)